MPFLWLRGAPFIFNTVKSSCGVTPEDRSNQDVFLQKAGTMSNISMVPNACDHIDNDPDSDGKQMWHFLGIRHLTYYLF